MKIVVCITFCLIICLGHGFTQPRNLKSLSPMLTMRQEKEERMFFDYIEVNKRPWEDVNLEKTCSLNPQYRTLDGYCNNKSDLEKGMAGMPFEIISQPLRSAASNAGLPLARRISNNVCNEDGETENDRNMSEMMTFFGQFLDHTLTETSNNELQPIAVPPEDEVFTTDQYIPFMRTVKDKRGIYDSPINKLERN